MVTPVSHLFKDKANAEMIANNSDYLEAREITAKSFFKNTTHYHIDFDLNLGFTNQQINFLKESVKPREEILTLTFQASKDCDKVLIEDAKYKPNSRIIPLEEQIQNTKNSVKIVKDIVGSHRSIGIENNNFFKTGAYDISTSLDYLLSVLEFSDLHLLLDVAHAQITCFNKNIDYETYIDSLLSTEKCKQMHLCQPSFTYRKEGYYSRDSHEIPGFEMTNFALSLMKKWNIKYITVEYYKNAEILVSYLRYIKELFKIRTKSLSV